MRFAFLTAIIVCLSVAGCHRAATYPPPPRPAAHRREAALDWSEKQSITQALIMFQGAFLRQDADGCLSVLTPELQRRYQAALHGRRIYDESGKTGQDILKAADAVRVESISLPHARAYYWMAQFPANSQRGIGYVDLVKINGHWKMASVPLDLPTPTQRSQ